MKVIFLQNVPGSGNKGQIKEVSEGYARHLLLPKKLAKPLDENALAVINQVKKKKERLVNKKQKEFDTAKDKINGIYLPLKSKVSSGGTLYAAIEAKQVSEELNRQYHINTNEQQVVFTEPIKNIGQHKVNVVFAPGTVATITVVASAE
jgi:large subunit ribosomal protein L9